MSQALYGKIRALAPYAGRLLPFWGLLLFCVALYTLRHSLHGVHLHDLRAAFSGVRPGALIAAGAATACSYLVLTCYDLLALANEGKRLPRARVMLASFVGWTLSNTVGFAALSGGAVRYRIYTQWGLGAVEIARVVAFCSLTGLLGLAGLGGMALALDGAPAAERIGAAPGLLRAAGIGFIGLVLAYTLAGGAISRMLKDRSHYLALPDMRYRAAQLLLGCLDLLASSMVLYLLLPSSLHVSAPAFAGFYMLALMLGLLSQVPGGLGVFEATLVFLLAPYVAAHDLVAALLLYRILYYLVPLALAAVVASLYETRAYHGGVRRGAGKWVLPVVPEVLSVAVFVCGVLLLASGATPELPARMRLIGEFLPLHLIEVSHFIASIIGLMLIVMAMAIHRRVDMAYYGTCALLAGGALFSLVKGLDYEEAAVLAFMGVIFLPTRRHFSRRAALLQPRFSPAWMGAVAATVLGFLWLGLFSYKHVEYGNELWWQFAHDADAPRFLRAAVGLLATSGALGLAVLLKPSSRPDDLPSAAHLAEVRPIVAQSCRTYANLALLGDKNLLFDATRTGFIMYGVQGNSWIALGDPVGPAEVREELAWRFKALCHEAGARPVFYQVAPENLSLYVDGGFQLLKLGEEARVGLAGFSLEGSHRKDERYIVKRLEREGYVFDVVPADQVPAILPELRRISDAWLAAKNTREKRFSLGFFDESYLSNFPVAIVRRGGEVAAFANIWEGAEKHELSIDLMRYDSTAPSGVMDFLFAHLFIWGKDRGFQWFNLGMAPLAGLETHALAPFWNQIGGIAFKHGQHFYNFEGLRRYKDKFDPTWQPVYLAAPGAFRLPLILADLAALIGGGLVGVVRK